MDESSSSYKVPAKKVSATIRPVSVSKNLIKRSKQTNHEHIEQVKVINWSKLPEIKKKYPCFEMLLFAVPNGGYRSKKTARDLKAEGVKSGVSDLLLLVPSQGYHFLAIEMKHGKNKQSDNQKSFEDAVNHNGGLYRVCYSAEDAISVITFYCNGKKV